MFVKLTKMKVFIEKTNKFEEIEASTVAEALKKLRINPTTVIVTKNDELVTEEEKISSKDEIKILSVISGG